MRNNWLSGIVGTTAFKYVVASIAGYLASKLGIDQGSVEGILSAAVSLGMLIWGALEASRDKVVIDGNRTVVPPEARTAVAKAVAKEVQKVETGDVVVGRYTGK